MNEERLGYDVSPEDDTDSSDSGSESGEPFVLEDHLQMPPKKRPRYSHRRFQESTPFRHPLVGVVGA